MDPTSKNTILIVEDSDEDFYISQRAFLQAGLANPLFRCKNGDLALDFLFRRGDYSQPESAPRPSLILLDLNMPGTDGREVLSIIKADPDLRTIPVIIFTTSDAEQDIIRCYEAGANSYIQKPIDMQGFFDALKRLQSFWFEIALLPKS